MSSVKKGFRGMASHQVEMAEGVPVRVEMTLTGGEVVVADLTQRELRQTAGEPLKKGLRVWCAQMAGFLARQAVEEQREKAREKGGAVVIDFAPPPQADITWWG